MRYKCENCGEVIEDPVVDDKLLYKIKEHDKLHRKRYDGEYK